MKRSGGHFLNQSTYNGCSALIPREIKPGTPRIKPYFNSNIMETPINNKLRRIGQGFCGSVWASPSGNGFAIKREDGSPGRSLYNDFIMHQQALKTLSAANATVYVPKCHNYITSDNRAWWDSRLARFPKNYQACNALITERIPAFSKAVRDRLIDCFCPEKLKSIIYTSEPDQDCLVRPYLGRRRCPVRSSRFQAFSLRNYPLHVDQIEALNLDGGLYARIMAATLAQLFWLAQIDANDLEFVLAPKPSDPAAQTTIIESEILGEHVVWILDFDCCKPMPMDEAGVKQAVDPFFKNDSFYPRPNRDNVNDQSLWAEFKDHFLETSKAILGNKPESRLPLLWVSLVEQRQIATS